MLYKNLNLMLLDRCDNTSIGITFIKDESKDIFISYKNFVNPCYLKKKFYLYKVFLKRNEKLITIIVIDENLVNNLFIFLSTFNNFINLIIVLLKNHWHSFLLKSTLNTVNKIT